MDSLVNGRRLKCLTIVDNDTKERLDIPARQALTYCLYQQGVELLLFEAGQPIQNACIERFKGKLLAGINIGVITSTTKLPVNLCLKGCPGKAFDSNTSLLMD